jgi:pyocin large subunit-like protein
MNRALRSFLLALVCAVAAWSLARTKGASPPTLPAPASPSASASAPNTAPAASPATSASPIGFRSSARLVEHYEKHGREFGVISQAQYLQLAQQLRDAPVGGDILEVVRQSDGVISRFDKASGAFLAADPDGTIRTFFKPNDGESYFRRQARRSPRS